NSLRNAAPSMLLKSSSSCFNALLQLLILIHLRVPPAELQQLLVGTPFDDFAVRQHDDLVGMLASGKSVIQHHGSAVTTHLTKMVEDALFCPDIHGREGVVQHQNRRIQQ